MPPRLWHEMDWNETVRTPVAAIEGNYRDKLKNAKDFWGLRPSDYEVIRVPKRLIPTGAQLVECYETKDEFIILGHPDSHAADDESGHNCDQMGCSSVFHVIARYSKQQES